MFNSKKNVPIIPGADRRKFPVIPVIAVLLSIVLLIALYRFAYNEEDSSQAAMTTDFSGLDAQAVLDTIYAENTVREVQDVTEQLLDEKYGLVPALYIDVYARQSSGRYGVADVFIVHPAYGRENDVREVLEQVKNSRIVEFSKYDVYNALEYSEDGQIFEVGGYICLIMIEDAQEARAVIESALGNNN